jgi:lipopolysaccharide/colanic/teichoic acid biosynthesis glycosyltransferase
MSASRLRPTESEQDARPVTAEGAVALPPARLRTRRTPRSTWLINVPNEDGDSERRMDLPVHVRTAELAVVVEQAEAGDMVLISGLKIAPVVQTCDQLLNRGVAVALDVQKLPAIRGLASKRQYGTDWVMLAPPAGVRVPLMAGRLADVIGGALAMLVIAPVLGVLMVAIRSTSSGRAIFRSPRVGRDGMPFDLFKLRSMRNSDPGEQLSRKELYRDFMAVHSPSKDTKLKVVDESRVTPIGRFLRKHSLDELPQFWNVIRGDLSLVGPRPCLPYEWDLHDSWHRLRFRSRPGLTGLWQAYGRSRVSFEEMVLMDYCYSWRKSLLLDLRIVLRTAVVVVTGEGGA